MKWAMSEKFKDYLWGAKVLVITDNNPLVHLRTAKLGAVEQRWVAQLANYDYQLQYRPGREHTNADVLSRLPEVEGRGPPLGSTAGCDEGLMVGIVEAPGLQQEEAPASWGWDPQRWKERQEGDAGLMAIRSWLAQGLWPEVAERRAQTGVVRKLLGQWERLYLRDGVVCRSIRDPVLGETVCQVVVPEGEIQALLQAYHTQLGHQGPERTVSLLRRHFHWPGI